MTLRALQRFSIVIFFALSGLSFGSGLPIDSDPLFEAVESSNFEKTSSVLSQISPGSIPEDDLKEILTTVLEIAVFPSGEHTEAINILRLFLKGDGKGFDLEDRDVLDAEYYQAINRTRRLENLTVTDAMRFIAYYNTPYREEVFSTLLRSRKRGSGLPELLWAIELDSPTLVKLVLQNLHKNIELEKLGTLALKAALYKPKINLNIFSTLVVETDGTLPHEWHRMYRRSFELNGIFSRKDRRQLKTILAMSLISKKELPFLDLFGYLEMLEVAFKFNDEPMFKLLARQMPTSFSEIANEFVIPGEGSMVFIRSSPPLPLSKALFDKVNLYHKHYKDSTITHSWVETTEQELEAARITAELAKLIQAHTDGLAAHPEAMDTYPLAGTELVITRDDVARESLIYLTAQMLVGDCS